MCLARWCFRKFTKFRSALPSGSSFLINHQNKKTPTDSHLYRFRASATDTLYAVVTMADAGHIQWKMIRDKGSVSLMLSKVPENLHH